MYLELYNEWVFDNIGRYLSHERSKFDNYKYQPKPQVEFDIFVCNEGVARVKNK